MKTKSIIGLAAIIIASIGIYSFTGKTNSKVESSFHEEKQLVNLVVSHGHCSTPFSGVVENLNLISNTTDPTKDRLNGAMLSFEINPKNFDGQGTGEITQRVQTMGLFMDEPGDKISFESTDVFRSGVDWYHVFGTMTIKGVEQKVDFFMTSIQNKNANPGLVNYEYLKPIRVVLEGKINLLDFGIDYDKILTGESDEVPTKWMYLNMQFTHY